MREAGVVEGPGKSLLDKTLNNHRVPQLNEYILT
jgi:hypothetical protein